MNPLLFTFTFLTLMGIITSSEVSRFTKNSLAQHFYENHLTLMEGREEAIQNSYFEDFKYGQNISLTPRQPRSTDKEEKKSGYQKKSREEKEPKAPLLRFARSRPPNNARLNFYELLYNNNQALYNASARLIRQLYPDLPPHIEYRLLDTLIASKSQAAGFSYPDELARLDLGDAELQSIFCEILTGPNSLLYHITFDSAQHGNRKKINLLSASREVLYVLLPSTELADQLILARNKIISEIEQQQSEPGSMAKWKNRTEFARELTAALEALISDEEIKKLFDFTLGNAGNILFIEDPSSKTLYREKYIPRKKIS